MVRHQIELTCCKAVVAVHCRRNWVRYFELGRVCDERCAQVDAVVEERSVVDGSDRHNDVALLQAFARFPLNDALVRATHVHHLSCNKRLQS